MMSEPVFSQPQSYELLPLFSDTSSTCYDLKQQFLQLQAQLCQVQCEKVVVQQICLQLVAEGIVDVIEVDKYITFSKENDLVSLVWMFTKRSHEDIRRFLCVLKNIPNCSAVSSKFSEIIDEVVPENLTCASTRSQFVSKRSSEVVPVHNVSIANVRGDSNKPAGNLEQINIDADNEETENNVSAVDAKKISVMFSLLNTTKESVFPQKTTGVNESENVTEANNSVKQNPRYLRTSLFSKCCCKKTFMMVVIGLVVVILGVIGLIAAIRAVIHTFSNVSENQMFENTTLKPTLNTDEPLNEENSSAIYETGNNTSGYQYIFLK